MKGEYTNKIIDLNKKKNREKEIKPDQSLTTSEKKYNWIVTNTKSAKHEFMRNALDCRCYRLHVLENSISDLNVTYGLSWIICIELFRIGNICCYIDIVSQDKPILKFESVRLELFFFCVFLSFLTAKCLRY